MKVILRIEFSCLDIDGFDVENPPVIPTEGEIVGFNWEDFITDREALKEL